MIADFSPESALNPPYRVLIKRDVLVDPERTGRPVPVKLYYPADHAPGAGALPVVFWSHGLGGSREGAGFLARTIAGHGYLVVHVQHPGTDSSLWEGKPGHPWDVIRATKIQEEAVIHRYLDIPFVADRLPDWLAQQDEMPVADFSRMGMSGHSFGALTTQTILGQGVVRESGEINEMIDSRFKAGIAYSPVPVVTKKGHSAADLYGTISRPLLHMTGTLDSSPVAGFDYEERLEIFEHAESGDQWLIVLEGGDHMVFSGSRGKLGKSPKREIHEEMIKVIALAFWDVFLKESDVAHDWLIHHLAAYVADEALIKHKDQGFF